MAEMRKNFGLDKETVDTEVQKSVNKLYNIVPEEVYKAALATDGWAEFYQEVSLLSAYAIAGLVHGNIIAGTGLIAELFKFAFAAGYAAKEEK